MIKAKISSPGAQPLSADQLARINLVPRLKGVRRGLGLTQDEFATRFQIPLGTLRDWETIAGDAAAVHRVLQAGAESAKPSSTMCRVTVACEV